MMKSTNLIAQIGWCREKVKKWRERQELTDRSRGWLIAGEDLTTQSRNPNRL